MWSSIWPLLALFIDLASYLVLDLAGDLVLYLASYLAGYVVLDLAFSGLIYRRIYHEGFYRDSIGILLGLYAVCSILGQNLVGIWPGRFGLRGEIFLIWGGYFAEWDRMGAGFGLLARFPIRGKNSGPMWL